jgi:hypothetical protein
VVRHAYTILIGKSAGKRPLRRPRRRWEENKTEIREMRCEDVHWIHLAQDRSQLRALVNMAMNLLVP